MKSQTHQKILDLISASLQTENFEREQISNQLRIIGVERDLIEETYLDLGDEITARTLIIKKQKRAKIAKKSGPILTLMGIILSLLSYVNFFPHHNVRIFFYGAIVVGLLSWFQAKKAGETLNLELKMRDRKVKNWF